jgi:hypothetical protein
MKITKTRLKEIIKEEVEKILEGKKYKRDTTVSGVKVEEDGWHGNGPLAQPIEEEELEETSVQGGVPTGAVAGYSGPVKKEDKLSPKQSKEMDTDKDGDIDAKDLKALRHS